MPLNVFSEAISLSYLTLIALILLLKLSEKLKTSDVLNSNFELRSKSKTSNLHFFELFYLRWTTRLNILSEVIKSQTYYLNIDF